MASRQFLLQWITNADEMRRLQKMALTFDHTPEPKWPTMAFVRAGEYIGYLQIIETPPLVRLIPHISDKKKLVRGIDRALDYCRMQFGLALVAVTYTGVHAIVPDWIQEQPRSYTRSEALWLSGHDTDIPMLAVPKGFPRSSRIVASGETVLELQVFPQPVIYTAWNPHLMSKREILENAPRVANWLNVQYGQWFHPVADSSHFSPALMRHLGFEDTGMRLVMLGGTV